MERKIILSLCDYSGAWSKPYRRKYHVVQVDPKLTLKHCKSYTHLPMTVEELSSLILTEMPIPVGDGKFIHITRGNIRGILAAPPCDDFSGAGARWWKDKDKDGRTRASLKIVDAILCIVYFLQPGFWVLENPKGRLPKLRPELGKSWNFQPNWFGDPYKKFTCLWGEFNTDLVRDEVEPIIYETSTGKRGAWYWMKLGGKSERTKELRSITPSGFAKAFYKANP